MVQADPPKASTDHNENLDIQLSQSSNTPLRRRSRSITLEKPFTGDQRSRDDSRGSMTTVRYSSSSSSSSNDSFTFDERYDGESDTNDAQVDNAPGVNFHISLANLQPVHWPENDVDDPELVFLENQRTHNVYKMFAELDSGTNRSSSSEVERDTPPPEFFIIKLVKEEESNEEPDNAEILRNEEEINVEPDNIEILIKEEEINEEPDNTEILIKEEEINGEPDNTEILVKEEEINEELDNTEILIKEEGINVEPDNTEILVKEEEINEELDNTELLIKEEEINEEPNNKEIFIKEEEINEEPDYKETFIKEEEINIEPDNKEIFIKEEEINEEPDYKEIVIKEEEINVEPENKEIFIEEEEISEEPDNNEIHKSIISESDNPQPSCSSRDDYVLSDIQEIRKRNRQLIMAALEEFKDPEMESELGRMKEAFLFSCTEPPKKKTGLKRKRVKDGSVRFNVKIPVERRFSKRLRNQVSSDISNKKSRTSHDNKSNSLFKSIDEVIYEPKRKPSKFKFSGNKYLIKVEDVTQEMLDNIFHSGKKKYSPTGTTCHQCRQKTIDQKTSCRNPECVGFRGLFCGVCLKIRYGQDCSEALLDPNWLCPPCRGICNCSICRTKKGKRPTGTLYPIAVNSGYQSVNHFLLDLKGKGDKPDDNAGNTDDDSEAFLGFSDNGRKAHFQGGRVEITDCITCNIKERNNPENLLGFDKNGDAVMGGKKAVPRLF